MKVNLVQPKPIVAAGAGYLNLYLRGDVLSPGEVIYATEALATKNIDQPDGKKGPRTHVKTIRVTF